jgi:hypothetical protein
MFTVKTFGERCGKKKRIDERELQPLVIASRSKKGRRDQEVGTVNISPQRKGHDEGRELIRDCR